MNKYIYVLFFSLLSFAGNGQSNARQYQIDSLKNRLKNTHSSVDSIKLLTQIGKEYFGNVDIVDSTNPCIYYYNLSLHLAIRNSDKKEICNALVLKGRAYGFMGKIAEAGKYLSYAIGIAQSIKDSLMIANAMQVYAEVVYSESDIQKGINMLNNASKIFQELKDTFRITDCYRVTAHLYSLQGNYNEAIKMELKILKYFEKNDKYDSAPSKAYALFMLGVDNQHVKNLDLSIEYYLKSKDIWQKIGDKNLTSIILNNIGEIYEIKNKYNIALLYYKEALKTTEEISSYNNADNIAFFSKSIACLYIKMNDKQNGLKYLNKCLSIKVSNSTRCSMYNEIAGAYNILHNYSKSLFILKSLIDSAQSYGLKRDLSLSYQIISETYALTNDYRNAYIYQQKYIKLNDSLFNEQKSKQIAELQTQYETEKKEKQIDLLSKKTEIQNLQIAKGRNLMYSIIGFTLLIALISFLLFNQFRLKSRQKNIQLEQKLLRSQMNPHFIFNSLFAIQNFMLQNNGPEAAKYLSKFSKLIRMILENSREEYVSLGKEIETLKYYMELQTLRFKNKFDYHIEIDESIENDQTLIPPMLAQPLIENAIEHGFKGKEDKGHIHIKFSSGKNYLICEVDDDGIGREQSRLINSTKEHKHKSLATSIVKERLERYNQGAKNKIKLDIIDKEGNNSVSAGTKAIFYIPLFRA